MKYFLKNELSHKKVGEGWLFENGIGLNETSYYIYNLCVDEVSNKDILKELKKVYSIESEEEQSVLYQIDQCIKQLVEGELISIIER